MVNNYYRLLIDMLNNLGVGVNAQISSLELFKNRFLSLNIFNGWDIDIKDTVLHDYIIATQTGSVHVWLTKDDNTICLLYKIKQGRVVEVI